MSKISVFYADDHDRLDSLFQEFVGEKNSNPEKAQAAFMEFKEGLERHIVWEEELLFPQFEAKTGMTNRGPTQVMRIEHQYIRDQLNQIAAKLLGSLPTHENETALLEALSGHNHKEEMILYPAIDDLLTEEERRTIFGAMEKAA